MIAGPRCYVSNDQPVLRWIGSFRGLFFCRVSKPNAGTTAVLVDEFDVRFLKSPSYDPEGTRGAAPSSQ